MSILLPIHHPTSLPRPLAGRQQSGLLGLCRAGADRPRQLSRLIAAVIMMLLVFSPLQSAHATSRLKDVVNFEGVRDNMLVGYGLVVGLNGTGDTLTNAPFTERSLIGMLERLGINENGDFSTIKTKNIAAVMVTATLPPFSAQGARIDVTIGTLGDAKSLLGGTACWSPGCRAPTAKSMPLPRVRSQAASPRPAGRAAPTSPSGVPTAGRISPMAAIVEREVKPSSCPIWARMHLSLRNPDFTTAQAHRRQPSTSM